MPKISIRFVCLLLFFFAAQSAISQIDINNYLLQKITVKNESAYTLSNDIQTIFQDTLGFIWCLSGQEGLLKYDGYGFEKMRVPYGSEPNIFAHYGFNNSATIDRHGLIWLKLAAKGIYCFNPYDYSIRYYEAFIQDDKDKGLNFAKGVAKDRKGEVWISTVNSVFRYDASLDDFELMYFDSTAHLVDLIADGGNDFFVIFTRHGNSAKFRKIHKTTKEVTLLDPEDPYGKRYYHKIWEGRGDYVWEANSITGIRRRNLTNDETQTLFEWNDEHPLTYMDVVHAWEIPNGDVWVQSATNEIYLFPKEQDTIFNWLPHTRSDPDSSFAIINDILIDQSGNYWLATVEGIYLFNKTKNPFRFLNLVPYFNNHSGSVNLFNPYSALCLINEQEMLIGTTLGLFSFNIKNKKVSRASDRYPGLSWLDQRTIYFIHLDKQQNFWINTWNPQLRSTVWHHYNKELDRRTPLQGFKGFNKIPAGTFLQSFSLFEDDQRQVYFYDFGSPYLLTLNQDQDSLIVIDYGAIHDEGYQNIFDKNGKRLWVVTQQMGVFLYDWKKETHLRFQYNPNDPKGIHNINNSVLFQDRNGHIFLASYKAIYQYDEESQSFSPVNTNLPGILAVAMLDDDKGNIWQGMQENGLVKVHLASGKVTQYTEKDGLHSNQFTSSEVIRDQNGNLYFAHADGVTFFHPDSLQLNETVPPVYITKLQLSNQAVFPGSTDSILRHPIHITSSIELKYQQNVLTLQYAALNYFNAEKNQYAYKLVGFDQDWQYVGNRREVTYTNLSPGTYTFRVKGTNNDGIWNEEGASLQIVVHPPWYRTNLAYLLYGLLILGSLYAFYRFQLQRQLEKQEAKRLKELDDIKSQLYTNITHEFRTPLTVILGMAERSTQLFAERDQAAFQQAIQLVKRNGQQLLRLVNQMLDLASIEAGKLKVDWKQQDVVQYLKYLTESFHSFAAVKQIKIRQEHQQASLTMDLDSDKLQKIVANLLSNAIKFTPEGGEILLTSRRDKDRFIFQVNDNGMGIPETQIPFVFDRFFRSNKPNEQGQGTGIGLALTKELVELLGGTIQLESKEGKGSTFTIALPIHREAAIASFPEKEGAEPAFATLEQNDSLPAGKKDASLVLIIEDNPEVAHYLAGCLENDYQLMYAKNGQEGIELAIEQIPDFIISDVMMPKKDGFEVCQILKTDERTSHIPIILLTAKADTESRISGLQQGADAYLTKPFNKEELQVRVRQMIHLRKKLQAKYQNARPDEQNIAVMDSSEPVESPLEDAFLQKLRGVIEEHILDPQLDVSLLCKKMALSRTQLHRKLSALTNTSTTHFIRLVRYEKAKELLRLTDSHVAEVAYEAGFSDPAYFSRMFKKEVGITPSEYRAQHQA